VPDGEVAAQRRQEIRRHDVVGVEHAQRVVRAELAHALDAPLQGVALGAPLLAAPFEGHGARLACHFGRAIAAVVGDDVDTKLGSVVVLGAQTLHHRGHHALLVMSTDQHGKAGPAALGGRSAERQEAAERYDEVPRVQAEDERGEPGDDRDERGQAGLRA
jgi:hypothetical protein